MAVKLNTLIADIMAIERILIPMKAELERYINEQGITYAYVLLCSQHYGAHVLGIFSTEEDAILHTPHPPRSVDSVPNITYTIQRIEIDLKSFLSR